jgi:agmatine/peptidylarginine deiminase
MKTRANVCSSLIVASFLATMLLVASIPTPVLAQTDSIDTQELDLPAADKDPQLPIGLTEEEKTRLHEIGINHIVTAPPIGPVREAAEWEPLQGVLVRYNNGFGLPYSVLQEFAEDLTLYVLCVASQQTSCTNNLTANGVNMANVVLLDMATNSIWTRDYGPQIVFANGVWGITDWIYNRPRPLDDDIPWQLGTEWGCTVYGSNLVATGGNYMADGHGNGFSTDMVWDENSGMTHAEIAQDMADYLGISNYVVVPDISTSGIHHIDVWAKLVNEETILVQEVDPGHSLYPNLEDRAAYLATLTNCYGRPYNIVRVFCTDIGGGDVAGHINALILNNKVFVPTFGVSSDATALATFAAAMPGYEVFGYDGSWLSDDAIHCRGMEIHDRYMLRVDTNPLQDQLYNDGDYRVTAFVDDRSEAGLVTDSLIVYWRLAGSPGYNAVTMSATASPDSYYADIPQQAALTDIEYYVFARDNSDRRETRPMVAPADWYTFNTGLSTGPAECLVQADTLDFGIVPIGGYKDTTFTITNIGGDTLSGDVSASCAHYSIISGGGPYSLTAGQFVTVTVRYVPPSLGTHTCTVETGQAICSDVFCTGEAQVAPFCLVQPDYLDFGTVVLGSYEDTTFTITNTGGSVLSGDVSASCSHYSIVSGGGPYSLTAGQFVTVTVRFEPTSTGTHNCSIETGQAICSDVSCTGLGALDYASLPYTTGFESGALDQYWLTQTTFDGRLRVLSSNTPHSGTYHLVMDDAVSGGDYSQTEAWLHVDLAGMTQVDLEFWWKEFGDETHTEDGVYFSDDGGASFSKVQNLDGDTNDTWNVFNLDVDQLATTAGLSLTGTFVIKFQQYDNYPITNDGFAFDDISVTGIAPPVCSVQPDTLDFGTVVIGGSLDTTFVIKNTGGSLLTGDVNEACAHR